MFRNPNDVAEASIDATPSKSQQSQRRTYAVQTGAKHGLNERPRCMICKLMMRLTRRESHPVRGPSFELQTFTCRHCGQTAQATVASPGAVA